jgi:hypothetical protein
MTGLGATKLRELFDDRLVPGRWVVGRGGQHRRWNRQALIDWHAANPNVARPPRRVDVTAGQADLLRRIGELERNVAGLARTAAANGEPLTSVQVDELGRLRAENVALREAALLAGVATQAVEEAWRLSDQADQHRHQAQQRLREAVELQQQALAQFLLPGVVPARGSNGPAAR